MALDDLLHRLKGREDVTPGTPDQQGGVTPQAAPSLSVTPVTPETPEGDEHRNIAGAVPEITAQHLRDQGLDLQAEDVAFLRWHLPRNREARSAALTRYAQVWRAAMEREPLTQRKQNVGRRAANDWIRGRVDRLGVNGNGKGSRPWDYSE